MAEVENEINPSHDFKIPIISRQSSATVFPEIEYESKEVRRKKIRTKLKLSLAGNTPSVTNSNSNT